MHIFFNSLMGFHSMNIKNFISHAVAQLGRLVPSIVGTSTAVVPLARTSLSKQSKVLVGKANPLKVTSRNVASESNQALSVEIDPRTFGEVDVQPLEPQRWLTVKQTAARYPCFSENALRNLIFSAEAYARCPKAGLRSNGIIDCIVRPAGQRKIIIDTIKFEAWLENGAFPVTSNSKKGKTP